MATEVAIIKANSAARVLRRDSRRRLTLAANRAEGAVAGRHSGGQASPWVDAGATEAKAFEALAGDEPRAPGIIGLLYDAHLLAADRKTSVTDGEKRKREAQPVIDKL